MNGIFISQCCGCAGKQCTRRYNFDDSLGSMDVAQFRAYDDPGGSTPVTVYWDYGAEELDIEGEGCYAVEIIPASVTLKTIHVAAMVAALTSGSVGVTIRRPESAESISLWWLGGTSYELRHGTTVLESITHTAATDEIKLELATPKDPTTDVLVYIGGALVHTETAVAFVMPDVLNLGVAIDGEATVDWVEVSPCPVVCGTSSDCDAIAGVPIPKIWTVEVPATTDSGSGCTDYCESFAGTFRLLARKEVSFIDWASGSSSDRVWRTAGVSFYENVHSMGRFYCSFIQIRDTKDGGESYWITFDPFMYEPPVDTMDPETWPIESRVVCADPAYPTRPYLNGSNYQITSSWVLGFELDPVNPTANYRLSLATFYHVPGSTGFDGIGVKYSSAYYLTNDPTPLQGGPITLNLDGTLDGSPLTTGCEFPASVTVTPGTDAEFMGRLCETGCTPPVTPQPGLGYFTWISFEDEDGEGWEYPTCLEISYNETTGSWEWSGYSTQGHVHSTCGTLPDQLDFFVKIHCVEPQEGEAKQWVMDITTPGGTARLPQMEDAELGYIFEGTSDYMCSGQTWDAVALPVSIVNDDSAPSFGSCALSPCTALWARAQVLFTCGDFSQTQVSVYLNRSAKGNVGSPPSEWTVPGVDPASIYGNDVYVGAFPLGVGYTLYLWADSVSTYQWKVSHVSDPVSVISISGSESISCSPITLADGSGILEWWDDDADPFGICPADPFDKSASVDVEWSL